MRTMIFPMKFNVDTLKIYDALTVEGINLSEMGNAIKALIKQAFSMDNSKLKDKRSLYELHEKRGYIL